MTAEEILEDLNVEFLREGHHHCRPGWIQLDCPFCGKGAKKYHLGWNLIGGYTNCWKCGGHSAQAVLIALGLNRDKAAEIGRAITLGTPITHERTRVSYTPPAGIGKILDPHKKYLRDRGFDPKEIKRLWQIQGIGISLRLNWRIFIPIILDGEAVSWTSRSIDPKAKQRYLSASAEQERINHKHLVYGQDFCRHSVIVCEGPMDAWRIGPGAGALFGTAFSTAQVKRLIQHPNRYIVFDNEPRAQEQAEELASQLSVFPGTTENIILDASDPGSASDKEIRALRRIAKL